MIKIKVFLLLLISIFLFQSSYSQGNYTPGYVIKDNADTLRGLIDYRNWERNPNKIKFKTSIENTPITFKSTDITEFKVKDEIYVSGIINTEVSPTQTNELTNDSKISIAIDTGFLQTLFRGEKSLYYYKNSDNRDNFYIKQDTGFSLLVYKRFLRRQDGKRVIAENKKYIGQLILYLNDCATIDSELNKTSYSEKSLIKLFQHYYECSSSDITFQKEIAKIHTEIGVLAGASLTSLEFSSVNFPDLVNADYNSSINPSAGLFFDFILPRNRGKWSLYNELQFTTYKVQGSYEEYENENDYSITTTEIGYSYLSINNLVRFKYPINQWFLFFNAGISNGFTIDETNYKKRESKFYTTERIEEGLALNDHRKHEQSLLLGMGIKYDRLSLELRYQSGNGMSDYSGLSSSAKRYFFLLGYRF